MKEDLIDNFLQFMGYFHDLTIIGQKELLTRYWDYLNEHYIATNVTLKRQLSDSVAKAREELFEQKDCPPVFEKSFRKLD